MKIELILLKKATIRENDYEFRHHNLGLFEVEAIPRIGETVYYEVDDNQPGYYHVKFVFHHIEPKHPTQVTIISDDDKDYLDRRP